MSFSSYRDSHCGKGAEYHESFSQLPHRKVLWNLEKAVLTRIIREFARGRKFRYLDFACGTGRIIGHVSKYSCVATGVDISESMLEVTRNHLPGVELIHADLTRDDRLGARQFDLITSFRFFPNAEPALRLEVMDVLSRHLAPAGRLIFNNHKNDKSLAVRVATALGRKDSAVREGV